MGSRITQTAESITAEATRATNAENSLAASVNINAQNISTKVSKASVVSEINQSAEGVKIKGELLEMTGNIQMTGGYINIIASEAANSIILLGRADTKVGMGTDGLISACTDGRTATVAYSGITISNGNLVAQMTDGGKGISSYGWESYSDRRLKHDIGELDADERAAFIYDLQPCRFKYNYDPDEYYRHGLIAQDVQERIGDEAWAIVGKNVNPEGEEYLTVNYSELIADLIATVQSLNKRVTELEEKVNE